MGAQKVLLNLLTQYHEQCQAKGSFDACVFKLVAPDDYFRIWYHAEQWVAICNACQHKPKEVNGLSQALRLSQKNSQHLNQQSGTYPSDFACKKFSE